MNDPTWRAGKRPAPRSGVVHATVPRVPFGDREVGAELVNETAGIDSKLVPAQYHSWGHQVDTSYVERRDNAYLVTGTRVSLDSIVYAFLTGASAETIAQAFPILSLEQVYGAIAFYLAQREEVDRYLATRAKDFDALREASRKADPFFYQKLADVRRGIEPIR